MSRRLARPPRVASRLGMVACGCVGLLIAAAGCDRGPRTVPVSGRVTFGGQPPPPGCVVNFLPQGVELPRGPGQNPMPRVAGGCGECDASGAFTVRCLGSRVGLKPGRYEVLLSCVAPGRSPGDGPVSLVPPGFAAPDLVVPAEARSVRCDISVPAAGRE